MKVLEVEIIEKLNEMNKGLNFYIKITKRIMGLFRFLYLVW